MRLQHIGLLLVLLLSLAPFQVGAVEITILPLTTAGSPKALAAEYLKRLCEERSSNRISAELVFGQGTQTEQQLLDALDQGKALLAIPEIRTIRNAVPLLQIYETPFLFRDRTHLHQVLDQKLGQQILKQSARHQLKPLAVWDGLSRQLLAEHALTEPVEDIARLFLQQETEAALTTPTWQEVTLAELQRRQEYGKTNTLTLTRHSTASSVLLISRRFWSNLPEDLKIIITGAVKDATKYMRELSAQADREHLATLMEKQVLERHELTAAERRQWQNGARQLYSAQLDQVQLKFIDMIIKD